MTKLPVQPEHVQLRVIPTIVQRHAEDASSYWRAIANNLEGLRVAQLESAQARAHRRFGLVGHQEPAEPLGHQRRVVRGGHIGLACDGDRLDGLAGRIPGPCPSPTKTDGFDPYAEPAGALAELRSTSDFDRDEMNESLYERALGLLGQTEREAALIEFMSSLGVQLPIARPPRGEKEANVELPQQAIELLFTIGSELPGGGRYAEGEMVFSTFFIHPKLLAGTMIGLPLGIDLAMTREQARFHFGEPEWTSRGSLKNDRWVIGDKRMLLSFTTDEQRIRQVSISKIFE